VISLVAITDADGPLPEPPLRAIRVGSLCAVCEPRAGGAAPALDALAGREALIERLMEDRDLLPVRFGADLEDEGAATDVLTERHDELRAALERVRGAVELSVRVRPADGDAPDPDGAELSGRAYLAARTTRSRAASELHEALLPLARAATRRAGPDLLRAAYLVEREAVPGFVAEVNRLQAAHPDLALLCTGPWAPFSFTGDEEAS
jgi:hypothetical protein